MINTYTSYQLLTRDMATSLTRVGQQPMVQRETQYYLENIGKVKSAEEFVNNYRLFNYAMKAHGLEDMVYAKAFMIRALNEGIEDPDSFANKLTDKRYTEFVRSFNFAAFGEDATSFNLANHGTTGLYAIRFTPENGQMSEAHRQETDFYSHNIGTVKSIDQFLHEDNGRLLIYALRAYDLDDAFHDTDLIREMLEGGVDDPDSPANKDENERWADFVRAFNFDRLGEHTTTYSLSQQPAVDKYVRQTLEEDAGVQNEGVRLALYFERKAGEITSVYEILGDRALATVVRTLLMLPDEVATLDVDRQAAMLEARLDIEDFQDPEKVEKMLTRFTTLWELNNPSSSVQSSIVSLFQPVEFGISVDMLMAIASIRR